MKIVELFKSIDGEGIRTGVVCTFIRGFGCCCRCSYCDSMYANEVTPGITVKDMTVEEIVEECIKNKTPYITFTGGEPLIQKDAATLVEVLLENGFFVNIETSGAVDLKPFLKDVFNDIDPSLRNNLTITIDYKSISSGCKDMMIWSNFVDTLKNYDVVKFVVGTKEDLDDMQAVVDKIRKESKNLPHFFVSPIFGMIEPADIVEYLKDNDLFHIRMQIQLHKVIWEPTKRGV